MTAIRETSPCVSPGFTLVELLMAMLILTVGLLGLLQAINVAYEHSTRNRLRDEAVMLGEEWMNDFRRLPFDRITANNSIYSLRRPVAGGKNFTVTRWQVRSGTVSKRLRVAVRWSFKNVTTVHQIYSLRSM